MALVPPGVLVQAATTRLDTKSEKRAYRNERLMLDGPRGAGLRVPASSTRSGNRCLCASPVPVPCPRLVQAIAVRSERSRSGSTDQRGEILSRPSGSRRGTTVRLCRVVTAYDLDAGREIGARIGPDVERDGDGRLRGWNRNVPTLVKACATC